MPLNGDRRPPPSNIAERAGRSTALRNAAVFMAVVVGGFAVKSLQTIITPLVVALFLLLLIDGFSRAVARRFPSWPEWVRLTLAVVLILVAFGLIVEISAHYGRAFGGQAKVLQPKVDALLMQVTTAIQLPPLTTEDLFMSGDPAQSFGKAFGAARGLVSGAVLTVIYLGFLLASREAFGRKAERMFRHSGGETHARRVFERVRTATEQYMGLQTLKAGLMGLAGWAIMAALGEINAPFLAFLIFLAAYVPIVGGIAGVIVPSLLALAQFDNPLRPLAILLLLGTSFFLIENVLLPKLQSERLNIDPVFVVLSLGFWGAILGIPGALLSTPLTVVVMAVTSEFEGARWLALVLSKEGELATAGEVDEEAERLPGA